MNFFGRRSQEVPWLVHPNLTEEQKRLVTDMWGLRHEDMPARLAELHSQGLVTPLMATSVVARVWRGRTGINRVPDTTWRSLFELADYTDDLVPARRPRRALRLYRGATAENRLGFSWTTDIETARHFVQYRQAPGAAAFVWEAAVEPERIFCHLTDEGEYVVDTNGLSVTLVEDRTHKSFRRTSPLR
jgi:hypothetical protein